MIRELDLPNERKDTMHFWITYRSLLKNQLVKFRSNCVEEVKKQYFRGECYCLRVRHHPFKCAKNYSYYFLVSESYVG
jgi:hypothetical protein